MLELNNISLSLGNKQLLDQVNIKINAKYKVGLVGCNGSGKSSLIKMLLGIIQEDSGNFNLKVANSNIGYLEQSLPVTDLNLINYVQQGDLAWAAIDSKLKQAELDNNGELIAACHEQLGQISGYTIEARAAKILIGLGFSNEELHLPVSDFSGGWQMRMQLARVLLSRCELLLLDEPTNHLDINAIIWLENWLNNIDATILVISHDREFLDNISTHTLYLARAKLTLYTGNYSAFSRQLAARIELEGKQNTKTLAKQAHLQQFINRFKAKASKAKQAQSRIKALNKLSLSQTVFAEEAFSFDFINSPQRHNEAMRFNGAIGYNNKIIVDACKLELNYGDRIGLIGKNGQGKTTLLKTLAKQIMPVNGKLETHVKLKIGYFSQHQLDNLQSESTPLRSLCEQSGKLSEADARKFLGKFNFSNERVFAKIKYFSGGEKARLALALLVHQEPNLLLLDEPTNHLDMQMCEAFIIALQNYSGAAVIVSHDRNFISSVVDEIWYIGDQKLKKFSGDLNQYRQLILDNPSNTNKKQHKLVETNNNQQKNKDKLFKNLERQLEQTKQELTHIEQLLSQPDIYLAENKVTLDRHLLQHKKAEKQINRLELKLMQL